MRLGICCLSLVLVLAGCATNNPTISKANYDTAARMHISLALNYLEHGNTLKAKEKLAHAEKLKSDIDALYIAKAFVDEAVGDYDSAKKNYQRALYLASNGENNNNYGAFLCRHGDIPGALKHFKKAQEDKGFGGIAGSFENAGLCAMLAGNKSFAQKQFESALKYDPGRSESLLELALLLKESDPARSKLYFDQYDALGRYSARGIKQGHQLAMLHKDKDKIGRFEVLLDSIHTE